MLRLVLSRSLLPDLKRLKQFPTAGLKSVGSHLFEWRRIGRGSSSERIKGLQVAQTSVWVSEEYGSMDFAANETTPTSAIAKLPS